MKLARRLLSTASLFVMCTGVATAVPITFQLDNVTAVGGTATASTTYVPSFPLIGSGNIDFGTGTGSVTLPDYSLFIDVNLDGDDAQVDITNWSQTITAIDGSGNITSTGGGEAACTVLGGIGSFVCPTVSPTIAGWPPADGPELLSSAVIDEILQTITIIDNSSPVAGTVTQFYSYTIVPEPSTAFLLLGGLALMARARRA
jgi:hypothetical protein